MILFFATFFTLYSAGNYYIFIRGWQALEGLKKTRIVYSVIFVLCALAYVSARGFLVDSTPLIYDTVLAIGSLWFAFMLYFFLSILIIDLLRIIMKLTGFKPEYIKNNYLKTKRITGIVIVLITIMLIGYGYYNAFNLKVNEIEITLSKKESNLEKLRVVFMSDTHLTPLNDGNALSRIVKKVNELNPDIILLAGDIVDDQIHVLERHNVGPVLQQMTAHLGIFTSNGNHEFIVGVNESVEFMNKHGITVVRDSAILVDSAFYIIGREDVVMPRFTGKERKSLNEIVKNIEGNYPLFLLDHTPVQLNQAVENGIDLQLSGHTHHGQMFPINLITNIIYELSWGYMKKENTHFYVTSGVGTWGPPVRIGSDAEIVLINITFE